uniref:Uncharacterized protein n=1 Tax=Hordeum vulgare subsp. vulgare TaxID=112509 RepID=A0A8I6YDD6_HORVV
MTIPSPEVDQAVFFLRNHAVTLSAADGVNASSPMVVGRALEAQLAVSTHSLRVTAHHPEHFFAIFTQPAHQVNAVRRATIRVDSASFTIASWHEHDHASFDALLLHVRVVIEGAPMQFWFVDGAEEIPGKRVRVDRLDSRTLERGHTKTFACWVWTNDVANIPTRHTLGVLPRGAGHVEEMEGFSPPDRRVAPPPATADYEMLIHVDRVEDWAPPSPRSSHSGQSGIPSSGSDDDTKAFPAVSSTPWTMGVEDGQRPNRHPRQKRAPVASLGCRGLPRGGQGRDHDGEDNRGHGAVATVRGKTCCYAGEVPWLSPRLLRPLASVAGPLRRVVDRGRPRVAVTATGGARGRRARRHSGAVPVLSRHPQLGRPPWPRCTRLPIAAAVQQGHSFAARTLEVQLGAVTSRVCQLEIAALDDTAKAGSLFCAPEPPLLNRPTSVPRRSTAPPKSRAIYAPTRHSARQAAAGSTVPVAKRASLRIVKELGLLGPKE